MPRPLGYKPSPNDKLGAGRPTHMLFTGTLPDRASIRDHVAEVLDQGQTNSCVAHAVTQQIRTSLISQGTLNAPLPSRLFVYFGARALNGEQNVDEGTYIHSAYECLETLGFPPESDWAFSEDMAKLNAQPDWAALRSAADQRWLGGHYRITSDGASRVNDVKAALAADHGVTWGTYVDDAFMYMTRGDVWPGIRGVVRGGHATLITGYGPGYFEFCNSWGTSFADNGFGRVAYDAVASPNAKDFWVAEVAPTFSEAA